MDFRERIVALLVAQGVADADALVEIPPEASLGDYALPCFPLAKALRKAPPAIAADLAGSIHAPFLKEVRATGAYVNFFIKPDALAVETLAAIRGEYGKQARKDGRVMVEYSQPNTHKAFHVGHLRGTSLGEALSRILRYAGWDVVQANYSGDTGAHIAKWLWYYTTRNRSAPPTDRRALERWIADIYVCAIKELTEHPDAQGEVDAILRKLDAREQGELMDIYGRTRQDSIDAFNAIYDELHAHFDCWFFESEVEEAGKAASAELVARGIAKVDDGATIIDMEDEHLGVWVLLRKDGTALYSAKDIALAERKFNEFRITKSVYVIGAAQSLHMQQLFATLRRMGFPHADKCHHLSFAEVRLPTGKMSSRTGQNLLYSDIREQVAAYARDEVRKRHEDWDEARVDAVARKVTIAALKWDMLAITPSKPIVFDPREATQFEGETGPYLQYTYARACGILEKVDAPQGDGALLAHEREQAVLKLLAAFPEAIEKAAQAYEPAEVARYAMALGKAFNSFYHDCPVLQATPEVRADRLALVRATVAVLGRALDLLAIDTPEEM